MIGIGEIVRDARLSRGLTQKELAERLNVSQQAISSIEAERSAPTVYTLLRIGEALEMRLNVYFR